MTDLITRLKTALADRYAIEREIGSGGMATVYLAQDLRHDRKVAVKVLKPELAAVLGADRFLSEIKTTANLQHPHILPLFDSGEADGFLFYVMPFVEGESLRGKLDREKQLSVDEAVGIAKSVASALDYAHRHGVIHRDIKPANILLHDGQPMVADFGIALAVRAAGGERLTETGLSLGTPHYMSPEQAAGDREVDGRSDLYSLGAVLYEMLTGEPPHSGPTVQAIIAKLLTDKPRPVTELRETVAGHVAATIHKALEKLPADRFREAREFQAALEGRASVPIQYESGGARTGQTQRGLTRLAPWGLSVALAILTIWLWTFRPPNPSDGLRHLAVVLPDSIPLVFIGEATAGIGQTALALSPDGRWLVFVGPAGETTRLYLRAIDRPEIQPLPGTEGAFHPFFSPDGQWIAFLVGNQLKRVSVDGGSPVSIAEANWTYGGSWNEADRIAVTVRDGRRLAVVSAFSGAIESHLSTSASGLIDNPEWLPGNEWLVLVCSGGGKRHLCVMSAETGEVLHLRLDGGEPGRTVSGSLVAGTNPRFVPPGHLVYSAAADNTLMAVPFSPRDFRILGEPVRMVDGVRREDMHGAVQVAISGNGDLAFASGDLSVESQFVWADGTGAVDTLDLEPRVHAAFQLSPDKRTVAAVVSPEVGTDELWFLDLEGGRPRKWIEGGLVDSLAGPGMAAWLNQEEVILIRWGANRTLIQIDAGRPNEGTVLWTGPHTMWVERALPDGRLLMTVQPDSSSTEGYEVLIDIDDLQAEPFELPPPLVESPGHQGLSDITPDGRWLAYTASETGPYEVWVVALPVEEDPIQVSRGGGELPRWSPRGDGLYYRNGQRWYWVARSLSEEGRFEEPVLFTEGDYLNIMGPEFEVSADGRRLLLLLGSAERSTTTLNLITNWVPEMRRRLEGRD